MSYHFTKVLWDVQLYANILNNVVHSGLGTPELEEGFPRHLGGASLFVGQLFNDNLKASKEFFDQKEIYFCGYALNANEKKR